MVKDTNSHGLSRYVEAEKRRQLRQEARFGCVKCGYAFSEYEHIDPEFKDATEHDVTKMAFLCKRCHGDVTAGRASKESIWKAKADPFCRRWGKPGCGILEFGSLNSSLGSLMFCECNVILRILGDDMLSIDAPEQDGGPIRVNAKLYDGSRLSLQIEDNAIAINDANWDVEVVGDVLTVRRSVGEPSLVYRFLPRSGIRVERLNMQYKGVDVAVDGDHVRVCGNDLRIDAIHAMFHDCRTCVDVRANGVCLGDVPRLPPAERWMRGNIQLNRCELDGGLCVARCSRIVIGNCYARGGIFVENGGTLSLAAGLIQGF